ncbi:hypothetical protein PV328_010901 [Microctonus aethiopoides]|uniref:Uncharacterized protein n=1 Tax=Microctonus aethiopoides TaxID=144406 RepID=A0AA39FJ26_9HYME|nr:hypothetical protein PV328_010901 [Microctonus aethiopoides]
MRLWGLIDETCACCRVRLRVDHLALDSVRVELGQFTRCPDGSAVSSCLLRIKCIQYKDNSSIILLDPE